ncbi:hypothetical protein OIV83_001606 [Microbotryomycetes sp. JL201]|nr:hypothetical protein OIV83_001606 [Microbotryomycetes sp. JL201]
MARKSSLPARYTAHMDGNGQYVPSSSPATVPAFLLHVVALGFHVNAFRLLWQPTEVKAYMDSQFGGQWSFLTVLSLAISTMTFASAIFKDMMPSVKLFDTIKTSLSVLAVPVEGLVSVLYWGMQFYDPKLLTPPGTMFKIPLFLDISIHALPALFLWIDFLVFSPRMSKSVNPLLISALGTLAYTTWMEYAAAQNKHFPYPFLDHMPPVARSLFYLCMIPVLLGLFKCANGIHDVVRGSGTHQTQAEAARRATDKIQDKVQ